MNVREGSPLRFGIMCDGHQFLAWEAQCIEHLINSGYARPALLIIDPGGVPPAARGSQFRKLKNIKNLLWYIFSYFLVQPKSKMLKLVDVSGFLKGVDKINCNVITKGRFSQYFSKEDIEQIRNADLDFILRFRFNIIRGEIHSVTKYGIWSYHHDDEMKYRGGPACFWEIYNGDPVTGAIMQRLTDKLDGGIILKKGFFQTNFSSFAANRDHVYAESAIWATEVCRDIIRGSASYIQNLPSKTSAPIYKTPTNGKMIMFFLRSIAYRVRSAYYALFTYWQWNVGVIESSPQEYLTSGSTKPVKWVSAPPASEFYADPFGVMIGDKLTILFEHFSYQTDRGILSAFVGGTSTEHLKTDLLPLHYHQSYPYVLKVDGNDYCIPEMSEAKEVAAYTLEEDLQLQKSVSLQVSRELFDATVVNHDGKWWMFATDKTNGPNYKLWIWFSDSFAGPWTDHPGNPVKVDIRSSRPAGTPFVMNGDLYRPSQDCSKHYGSGITVNRVTKLTVTEFEEVSAFVLKPLSPYPEGIHTLSVAGKFLLIDGVRRRFIGASATVIKYKLAKLTGQFRPQSKT